MIRLLEEKDFGDIQYIAKTSWHHTYVGIIPIPIQDRFLEGAYSIDMLKHRMENSLFLIHVSEGNINGFANFSKVNEKGDAELGAIYLLPEVQRQGIGDALLREGIRLSGHIDKLFVNVESENQKGYAFYLKKGFTKTNESEEIFYGHKLKTIKMCLTVPVVSETETKNF